MIMRRIAILVALVVAIGVSAYYLLPAASNKGVQAALDLALQKLPPAWTVKYKSAEYGGAANQVVLKGVEVHGTGATKLDAAIDEVDIAGLSLAVGQNWSEAAANPAALAPDKAVPIADRITVKGVTVDVEGQQVKLGDAEIGKARLYPWALLHDGVPGYNAILDMVKHPPADAKPEDILPVLRFEAAYLLGFGYDSYTGDDLAASLKLTIPDAPVVEVGYSIKKVSVTNFDRGKLEAATIDGIGAKEGTDFDVTIAHAAIAGLDVRNGLSQVLSGAALDPALLDGTALGKVEYTGIAAKTPSGPPVTLASVAFSNLAVAHGLLVSGEFSVAGLKLVKGQVTDDDILDVLNKWGLETATLSFGVGYQWDIDKKTAALKELTLKVDELGAVTLSADFAGIEKAETIAETASLSHAVLRYTDASFAGRAFKFGAAEDGSDPAHYGEQLAVMVKTQAGDLLGSGPDVVAATKAIGAFLTDPHNLTIELAPPAPLAFAAIDADQELPPPEIFAKLGIKVTANQ
jgi:hypothetical protein